MNINHLTICSGCSKVMNYVDPVILSEDPQEGFARIITYEVCQECESKQEAVINVFHCDGIDSSHTFTDPMPEEFQLGSEDFTIEGWYIPESKLCPECDNLLNKQDTLCPKCGSCNIN